MNYQLVGSYSESKGTTIATALAILVGFNVLFKIFISMKNTMLIATVCMMNVSIAHYYTIKRNQSFFLLFGVFTQKIRVIVLKPWLSKVWYIVLQKIGILLLVAHKVVCLFLGV